MVLALWVGIGLMSTLCGGLGVSVHLSRAESQLLDKVECKVCKAVFSELYWEVEKHNFLEKGEEEVLDSLEAICLAVVQNYTLSSQSQDLSNSQWEERLGAESEGATPGMRELLLLKEGCQRVTEDHGADMSGSVWKAVRSRSDVAKMAFAFCEGESRCGNLHRRQSSRVKPRASSYSKAEPAAKVAEAADPMKDLPEDVRFAMQNMMETANHIREEVHRKSVLICPGTCSFVARHSAENLQSRPASMRRQADLVELLEGVCEGPPDLSVPAYFGIQPPPLPALWTDLIRPWESRSAPRIVPASSSFTESRKRWRASLELRPRGKEEGDQDFILTRACQRGVPGGAGELSEVLLNGTEPELVDRVCYDLCHGVEKRKEEL